MDIKALECFITLYEERNMRKAAERLFMTQQGVSRIIISLEKELGCSLFERRRTGLEPTGEGVLLYDTAVRIQSEMAGYRQEISALNKERPVLRIACSFGVINYLYSSFKRFEQSNPDIELVWNEYADNECEKRLNSQEADIGIVLGGGNDRRFVSELLLRKKAFILVNEESELYSREVISVEDLRGSRIITFGSGFHLFDMLKDKCMEKGFCPELVPGIGSSALFYKLVSLGEGVGVAGGQLAEDFRYPGVKSIPIDEDDITMDYILMRRKTSRFLPWMKTFWEFITAEEERKGMVS